MSIYLHEPMINHHGPQAFTRLVSELGEILHIWWRRYDGRRQLAELSERDLHDIGKSWSDVAHEVQKPFWRA
jgi:uncharacterized protein YjiS (DUF1127 family)